MGDAFLVTVIINLTCLVLACILTTIYLLPIVLVRRFHTTANILTGNVCLTSISCGTYWIISNVIGKFYPSVSIQPAAQYFLSAYFEVMFNSLLVHSLAIITVNRYVTIRYPNKLFFKRRTWPFVSSIIQWIISIILPIPGLVSCAECIHSDQTPFWMGIYAFLLIVVLPSVINVTFNALIYFSVRSSTRRVQALTTTGNTAMKTNSYQHSRDLYLLKHMSAIFIVFILGWGPIYILPVLRLQTSITPWLHQIFQILPVISSLTIAMDLFLYNHDLRKYLKDKFLKFSE